MRGGQTRDIHKDGQSISLGLTLYVPQRHETGVLHKLKRWLQKHTPGFLHDLFQGSHVTPAPIDVPDAHSKDSNISVVTHLLRLQEKQRYSMDPRMASLKSFRKVR